MDVGLPLIFRVRLIMELKLQLWLNNYKKHEMNAKQGAANQRNALKKHEKKRSETFVAKCEKHLPEILRLNELDLPASDIADIIGVDRTHIYHILRKLNIKLNNHRGKTHD